MPRRSTPPSLLIVPLSVSLILAFAAHAETRSGRGSGSFAPVGTLGSTDRSATRGEEVLVRDDLTRALRRGDITEATYTLNRGLSIFHPAQVRARFGNVVRPGPRDGTPILRDLVASYDELSPAQRVVAQSILARPTDGAGDPGGDGYSVAEAAPICNGNACIHYVASTSDAPPPGWIDSTTTAFDTVWAKEIIQYGYRPPKSDITSTNHGPDARSTSTSPTSGPTVSTATARPMTRTPRTRTSSMCPSSVWWTTTCRPPSSKEMGSGVPALQVTLAHEFFHAVQGAYDFFEDAWYAEGTAAWMEDEVFDAVDDNLQYLRASQLKQTLRASGLQRPQVLVRVRRLDLVQVHVRVLRAEGLRRSEHHQAIVGVRRRKRRRARPVLARGGCERDQGTRLDLQIGVRGLRCLERRSWTGLLRRRLLPRSPVRRQAHDHRSQAGAGGQARHGSPDAGIRRVRPRSGVSSTARLRIAVDLPAVAAGSEASVVTIDSNGRARYKVIRLNRKGDGRVTVPFGRGRIATVDFVITNASERTRCWNDNSFTFSCAGNPKDDRLRYLYGAGLIQ